MQYSHPMVDLLYKNIYLSFSCKTYASCFALNVSKIKEYTVYTQNWGRLEDKKYVSLRLVWRHFYKIINKIANKISVMVNHDVDIYSQRFVKLEKSVYWQFIVVWN